MKEHSSHVVTMSMVVSVCRVVLMRMAMIVVVIVMIVLFVVVGVVIAFAVMGMTCGVAMCVIM